MRKKKPTWRQLWGKMHPRLTTVMVRYAMHALQAVADAIVDQRLAHSADI